MIIPVEFEKGELIPRRRLIRPAGQFEAEGLIEADCFFEVADTDPGVKKFDHERVLDRIPAFRKRLMSGVREFFRIM